MLFMGPFRLYFCSNKKFFFSSKEIFSMFFFPFICFISLMPFNSPKKIFLFPLFNSFEILTACLIIFLKLSLSVLVVDEKPHPFPVTTLTPTPSKDSSPICLSSLFHKRMLELFLREYLQSQY